MIDEWLEQIDDLRRAGAVFVLKWDGERAVKRYTVVVSRQDTDYGRRIDSDDMGAAIREALADYHSAHGGK